MNHSAPRPDRRNAETLLGIGPELSTTDPFEDRPTHPAAPPRSIGPAPARARTRPPTATRPAPRGAPGDLRTYAAFSNNYPKDAPTLVLPTVENSEVRPRLVDQGLHRRRQELRGAASALSVRSPGNPRDAVLGAAFFGVIGVLCAALIFLLRSRA